jgi:hypothetical protein
MPEEINEKLHNLLKLITKKSHKFAVICSNTDTLWGLGASEFQAKNAAMKKLGDCWAELEINDWVFRLQIYKLDKNKKWIRHNTFKVDDYKIIKSFIDSSQILDDQNPSILKDMNDNNFYLSVNKKLVNITNINKFIKALNEKYFE